MTEPLGSEVQGSKRHSAEGPTPEDIVAYWSSLRGGRRFPSKSDLDPRRFASDRSTSILMRCRSGSRVLEAETIFSGRGDPGTVHSEPAPASTVDLSPMMLQWLVSLAGEALRDETPMEDTEAFPALDRSVRYRAVALPLSEDQTRIDHVLCHVYRAL
ncbi:MAG: PAS domain-containing protein [Kiloniellaceae bacterium]